MQATYTGEKAGVFYRGQTFTKGEAVDVSEAVAARLAGNANFSVSQAQEEQDFSDLSVDELEVLLGDREIEGTGKNGRVLKRDMIAALENG